ncbi:MAG: hypothetical protein WCS77_10470, partial [Elusimicrobiaceae bacterium]
MNVKRAMNFNKTRGLLTGVGIAATVLLGIFFARWTVYRADSERRAELLQKTQVLAGALDLDNIRSLSGNETDLEKPEYQQLKAQLAGVRSATPQCRFIYLSARKADGRVFFLVDSESPDSKDYSPPGQLYEEVPQTYL